MARTSKHATGNENRVSEYDWLNLLHFLRKPTPSCHTVRSGRVDQLALPCTRIPLAPVPLGALRGTAPGTPRGTRETTLECVREALRGALGRLPATLRSVPEALRSALDVLRNAPEHAAGSGNFLRESWSGERGRPAQPATTPASSLKPFCSRIYPGTNSGGASRGPRGVWECQIPRSTAGSIPFEPLPGDRGMDFWGG